MNCENPYRTNNFSDFFFHGGLTSLRVMILQTWVW